MSLGYRRDVDGLRAVAIVPVVFYHYEIAGFSGGYAGVDVFFVISGFLITAMIHGEIVAGKFSLLSFYERRVRRIFPALFALIFVTAAFAYAELFPRYLFDYGKSLIATAGFLSNVEFWREAGYFAANADQKPLLHTWSLAVEEQYYLCFPLLMLLIARYGRNRYVPILAALCAASFALSVAQTYRAPLDAFYLLPSRMWELLIGALIAVGTQRARLGAAQSHVMAVAGLAMICAAVDIFTVQTRFPGIAALLPCAGTALILWAGQNGGTSFVNRLLATEPLVFIGRISYSLYLWHWPVYVFATHRLGRDLQLDEAVLLISASAILAFVSWRYVEQPFRRRDGVLTQPLLFRGAVAAMVAAVAIGSAFDAGRGLPQRFTPQVVALLASNYDEARPPCVDRHDTPYGPICKIGDASQKATFVVWGDSHARALAPAVALAAEREGRAGLAVFRDACPALWGIGRTDQTHCRGHNDAVMALIQELDIETVILISRWTLNAEGTRYGDENGRDVILTDDQRTGSGSNREIFAEAFARTVGELRRMGRRVVVVGPVPEVGRNVPESLARNLIWHSNGDIRPSLAAFNGRNRFVLDTLSAHAGEIETVYPHTLLCTDICAVIGGERPLYVDDNHLSHFAAESLSSSFDPVFQQSQIVAHP